MRLAPAPLFRDVLEGALVPIVLARACGAAVEAAPPIEYGAVLDAVDAEDRRWIPRHHAARCLQRRALHDGTVVQVGGVDLEHVGPQRRERVAGAGLEGHLRVGHDRIFVGPHGDQIAAADEDRCTGLIVRDILQLRNEVGLQVHAHAQLVGTLPAGEAEHRHAEHRRIAQVHVRQGLVVLRGHPIAARSGKFHADGVLQGSPLVLHDHAHGEAVEIGCDGGGLNQDPAWRHRVIGQLVLIERERGIALQGEVLHVPRDETRGLLLLRVKARVLHVLADGPALVQA